MEGEGENADPDMPNGPPAALHGLSEIPKPITSWVLACQEAPVNHPQRRDWEVL